MRMPIEHQSCFLLFRVFKAFLPNVCSLSAFSSKKVLGWLATIENSKLSSWHTVFSLFTTCSISFGSKFINDQISYPSLLLNSFRLVDWFFLSTTWTVNFLDPGLCKTHLKMTTPCVKRARENEHENKKEESCQRERQMLIQKRCLIEYAQARFLLENIYLSKGKYVL